MIKNADEENREHYKRANKIRKERVNKRKNKMWEMKCREMESMIES